MLPFLTAYDPLGSSSGSIDPLGALQSYTSLADLLASGRHRDHDPLAIPLNDLCGHRKCGEASHVPAREHQAWRSGAGQWSPSSDFGQLRVSPRGMMAAVRRRMDCEASHTAGKDLWTFRGPAARESNCDFQLLKFQARTGAVGTYWTAMVGGELRRCRQSRSIDPTGPGTGQRVSRTRLEEKDRSRLADPDNARRVSMALEELTAWSEECHLQAAEQQERQQLGEALTASDRRECVRAGLSLMSGKSPYVWNGTHLARLGRKFKMNQRAVDLGLPTVIDAITVTEQFHSRPSWLLLKRCSGGVVTTQKSRLRI